MEHLGSEAAATNTSPPTPADARQKKWCSMILRLDLLAKVEGLVSGGPASVRQAAAVAAYTYPRVTVARHSSVQIFFFKKDGRRGEKVDGKYSNRNVENR